MGDGVRFKITARRVGRPFAQTREGRPGPEWDVTQRSRGLGDTVAKITHRVGIERLVQRMIGGRCGCARRQAAWNRFWTYTAGLEGTEKAALGNEE